MKTYNLTASVLCYLVDGNKQTVRVAMPIQARTKDEARKSIGAMTWEYITDKGSALTSAPVESTDVMKFHLA